MPRAAIDDNQRMNLRVPPEVKSRLTRAASLNHVDLTSFVTQAALREADAVIAAAEQIKLTEDSYKRVLALLEDPPEPNGKLLAAARAMPKPA
ncbi:hypothetical protein AWB67_04731 [Caballeronia terrestris]|uniref:DUF1778 domain-containing protein n=3 Tax=Caballeronia TaxID=1827195 RepID=A0A158K2A6_9BURK|nr:DUF1778 domain-containing protein [Caballeronia humi]SAL66806.1 hypothetical protein AWB65_06397 [Caballeronia humi]SAL75262.1 hypothetical protein AWB67_04731 [Caballeronia terrestris]